MGLLYSTLDYLTTLEIKIGLRDEEVIRVSPNHSLQSQHHFALIDHFLFPKQERYDCSFLIYKIKFHLHESVSMMETQRA